MQYERATDLLRPRPEDALEAYAALVAANREQVDRVRDAAPEEREEGDFWAARAESFRPGRLPAEELPHLVALAHPADVWLDIGAGGGRFAIPLSEHIARVLAIEPSPAMRRVLAESAAAAGRANIEAVDLFWPPAADVGPPEGDVVLAANVLYDAPDLEAFLRAMETAARRLCVVIMSDRAPSTPDSGVFEALHGEPLCRLPGLREFVAVLGALGRRYDVRAVPMPPRPRVLSIDDAMNESRWRFWVQPDSRQEARLRELLLEHFGTPRGEVQLPPRRNYSAVVSWPPPSAR